MSMVFADFAEWLVSISDFSQGRVGKTFSDVAENSNGYIILKDNQPMVALLPIKEYKAMQEELMKMDRLLEYVENIRLLRMVRDRVSGNLVPPEDLAMEDGFTMEGIRRPTKSVEFD